jgi:hypothetical protein
MAQQAGRLGVDVDVKHILLALLEIEAGRLGNRPGDAARRTSTDASEAAAVSDGGK